MGVKERWHGIKEIALPTEEAVALIVPILQAERRVLIAYLFGSRVVGMEKKWSDLDIAIYTRGDFQWNDYYRLYGAITQLIKSDRLDLVWMNRAEPILVFEVIKNGKVLFYRNADELNEFESRVKKIYYDHVIYLKKRKNIEKEVDIGL